MAQTKMTPGLRFLLQFQPCSPFELLSGKMVWLQVSAAPATDEACPVVGCSSICTCVQHTDDYSH